MTSWSFLKLGSCGAGADYRASRTQLLGSAKPDSPLPLPGYPAFASGIADLENRDIRDGQS